MKTFAFVAILCAVACAVTAPAAASYFELPSASDHARHLAEVGHALANGCKLTAAVACAREQNDCLGNLHNHNRTAACLCFESMGSCLHAAGCLNGTNEDLHQNYCTNGDAYCCLNRGDFNGCGQRADFNGTEMCLCEDGYNGMHCNSTSATVCSTDLSKCNTCSTCCKDYSQATCEACTVDECDDVNVCTNVPGECNVCSACCKPYLAGDRDDCNLCVEEEC